MNRIKLLKSTFLTRLPYLIFFIGIYVYFGFFADYILFYQEKTSLFIISSDFFLENIHQPGGLVIYLGKLVSSFFYYPAIGALIISGIITLIVTIVTNIIRVISGRDIKAIALTTGLALFYLQADYRFLVYNNFGLLLTLACFYLSVRYIRFLKGWIPVLISPIVYFITGGFALIYYILLSTFLVLQKGKDGWLKIIVLWCFGLITFYISREFLFFQSDKTLLLFPFSDLNTGSQSKLFFIIAAILSLLPLFSGIRFRLPSTFRFAGTIESVITLSLAGIAIALIGFQRFEKKDSQYFQVEKLFYQNNFKEVIEYNTSNPTSNYLSIYLNNIALCETGKLNDQLFNFPQDPEGKTLFLKWEMLTEVLKRGGYFYYTIGMVNEAHRWAFENMVMNGHSPEGIKILIRTDIINANYKVAAMYIKLLKKSFFYKREAIAFEKLLNNEEAIYRDSELGEKRQNRLETDFFSITDNPYVNIEQILANDSLNKKAFEYKLALNLLRKDYQGIANELPKIESLGFKKIPGNVEEAIVTMSVLNIARIEGPLNFQINKDTEIRWNKFISLFQQFNNDPKAAEPALRKEFGNTFWYYVIYR